MDGTTVDTVKTIAYYANNTLSHFGLPAAPVENYNYFAGDGPVKLLERATEYVGGDISNVPEYLEYYKAEYDKNALYLTSLFDGIEDLLKNLKSRGIKTAILSNKQDVAVKKISRELLGDLIDISVGSKKDVPLKPNPASLFEMMDKLGVGKDEVLFVGDTNVDILTAKNAGVKSVGVLWGFRSRDELVSAGADYIVSSPEEMEDII